MFSRPLRSGLPGLVDQGLIYRNFRAGDGELIREAAGEGALQTATWLYVSSIRRFAAEAAPQDTPAVTQQGDAQPDTSSVIRSILARHLPEEGVSDVSQPGTMRVMRFGDLPTTTQLIESFQGAAQPKQPLYDLPAWLAASYPSYDTRPKSPFYDWVTWARHNLPAHQSLAYIALDKHIQHPRRRAALMKKAQWELSQLWDWQHRRASVGLPLEPTAEERAAASSSMAQAEQAAVCVAQREAQAALVRAEAAQHKAQQQAGWQQEALNAEVAVHMGHAVAAHARAHLRTPDSTQAAVLQNLHQGCAELDALLLRVNHLTDAITTFLKQHAPSKPTATPTDNPTLRDRVQQTLDPEATEQLSALTSRLHRRVMAIEEISKRMQQLVESKVPAKLGTAPTSTASTASTIPTAITRSSSESSGLAAAVGLAGMVQDGGAGGGGARRPKGLMAALSAADQITRTEFTAEQNALLASLDLTPDQWSLLRSLRRSMRNPQDSSTGSSSVWQGLIEAADRTSRPFRSRVKALTPARFVDRVYEALQAEHLARKGTKTRTSGGSDASHLAYSPDGTAQGGRSRSQLSTAVPASPTSAAVMDGQMMSAMLRASGVKAGGEVAPATAGPGKATTWADLPSVAGQAHDQSQPLVTALQTSNTSYLDKMVLDLGSPAPYVHDLMYRRPYTFDLRVRPPTFLLDLITDYMQVKYQDLLLRKEAVSQLEDYITPTSSSCSSRPRLSPQEVSEINRQANKYFDMGDVHQYTALMTRLAQDGLIGDADLLDHVTAVNRRASELRSTTSTPATTGAAPTDEQRASLLRLLSGASNSTGTALGTVVGSAEQEWTRSLSGGLAGPSSPWTRAVVSLAGAAGSGRAGGQMQTSALEALRDQVLDGSLTSWSHANKLWREVLELAGGAAIGPTLEEVVKADTAFRQAQAAAAQGGVDAAETLQAAKAEAARINAQLDQLHAQYLAAVRAPTGTFPATAASAGGHSVPNTSTSSSSSSSLYASPSGQAWSQFNKLLDAALKDPTQLLSMFQGSLSLKDVVRSHLDQVSVAHLHLPFAWNSSASPWDQLWSLTRSLYSHFLTLGPTPASTQPTSSSPAAPAGAAGPLAGVLPKEVAASAAEQRDQRRRDQQQEVERERKWRAYCSAQERQLSDALTPSTSGLHDLQLAPPYPGARPILSFTQCVVLGPASSMSSTQNLSTRLDTQYSTHPLAARMTGYRPPSLLLPDHPAAKRVMLKVQVLDLAQEVGLTEDAIQHLLRVAGPSRYDHTSGELKLLGTRYSSREENRKCCLEQLHLLLQEAHRHQQEQVEGGRGGGEVFLLDRPGVVNMITGR